MNLFLYTFLKLKQVTVNSRWVVGYNPFEVWQVLHILIVQPLDLEVQVHVVGTLTQPVLFMLCGDKHTRE